MFREIGVATGHCSFCGEYGTVAVLRTHAKDGERQVSGCERCWRATGNAANLLRLVRLGKAPKAKANPKKARKRATGHPERSTPYQGPDKHEVSSLVPANGAESP